MQQENGRGVIFQRERLLKFLKSLWDITGIHHRMEDFLLYPWGGRAKQKNYDDTELSEALLDFINIVLFY